MSVARATTVPAAGRSVAVDALRVVLALMVIGLHGHFLSDFDRPASYLLVQGLFRVAVPTFFVISGFYLEQVEAGQFGRWIRHVLRLYVLWMVLYVGYWWRGTPHDLTGLLRRALFGYHHLWFLIALAAAGTMLHLLRHLQSRAMLALAGLLAVTGLALQYGANWHLLHGDADAIINSYDAYRNFLFFGFPFMAVGFLLSRHEAQVALALPALSALLVAGFALLLAESAANLRRVGPGEPFDLLVSLYLVSPLLFLAARRIHLPGPGKEMALLATGIYLVHSMVLALLSAHTPLGATPKVLLTAAISAALAAVLIRVNRRLPVL